MQPDSEWAADGTEAAVETFESLADEIVVKVWGGDWGGDCRRQLPDFGAAMAAAGVDSIRHYPVEKADDGSKVGPGVEEYGIERIPTVIVEDGETGAERARFVESADDPIAVHLADRL